MWPEYSLNDVLGRIKTVFANRRGLILFFILNTLVLNVQGSDLLKCIQLFKLDYVERDVGTKSDSDLLVNFASESISASKLRERAKLARHPGTFNSKSLISELVKNGRMLYVGKHEYEPGSEFLASNEFDWARTPTDNTPTDLLIGFGTNSAWDLAMRKQAKFLVIGDWSPWPIIAQAYLVAPLLRIAKSPQEFILMLSGIPRVFATGLTIEKAFQLAKDFDAKPIEYQRAFILKHINSLIENPQVSESELRFLASYYSPRLGHPSPPGAFGPFANLRSPYMALLNRFYEKRYNANGNNEIDSVFSSLENFLYLKNLFDQNRIKYALTSITDSAFYDTARDLQIEKGLRSTTLSVSNIFDCGCYNGLTFNHFQNYIKMLLVKLRPNSSLVLFRTTNNQPPHGFYRYEIENESQIPQVDEVDSSALPSVLPSVFKEAS